MAEFPLAETFAYAVTFDRALRVRRSQVLIRSIQQTQTPHNVVVLVPPRIPQHMRMLLDAEGATVLELSGLQRPSDASSVELSAVIHARNKLLLWSLTQFRRIVYLEFDDLGLHAALRAYACCC